MFGPNTPATLIVLPASALLLIVTISTPIFRSIYFLSVNLSPSESLSSAASQNGALTSDLNGVIKLGLFGYCIQLGSQTACSSPRFGYTFDPASLISLPSNVNLDFSNWVLKLLTYPLILHPIASGLGFLSVIAGVISHFREFSRSRATSWLSSSAASVALFAFVFDILAFSLARNRINETANSNIRLRAQFGNAIWITLAGWVSLTLSGCFFFAARRIHSRRQRDQSQAHLTRPELDQDYSRKMREQAQKEEQAREKGFTSKSSSSNLPAFHEYADQDGRNQEHIPLNSFQPDEENYSHPAGHPEPHEGETLEGVGAGYGRRPHQGLAHQPSVMSQATVYTQVSYSQFPPMPPIPQRTQSYHNHSSSPLSNHDPMLPNSSYNPPSPDFYSNLPPHVTPTPNYMNPSPLTNHMNSSPTTNLSNQRPHTNSIHRHPQSLIPAGIRAPVSMIPYEPPPRGSYASPPSSQTSAIPSAHMYGLSQPVNHSSLPSSQPTLSGVAYQPPHPQRDLSGEPHPNHMNLEQPYTLDNPTPINLSSSYPPPIYQMNYSQVDPNQNHVPYSTESRGVQNNDNRFNDNVIPRVIQRSNQHDDPFTQTHDIGSYTRDAHSTEPEAGLGHELIDNSSHLLSSEPEVDEYDQSRGDTDYTAASPTEPPRLGNHISRRELPQVPVLPPLSFISPPASPLHPRNDIDFSGTAAVESHVPVTDKSHLSSVVPTS